MTFPVIAQSTASLVSANDYNEMALLVRDIMGRNPLGYGLDSILSLPVNTGTKILSIQWEQLRRDVNIIHGHITSSTTATVAFTTGSVANAATLVGVTGNFAILNTTSNVSTSSIIYDTTITVNAVTSATWIELSHPLPASFTTGSNVLFTIIPDPNMYIDATRTNNLYTALQWCSANRFTCAPGEYIGTYTNFGTYTNIYWDINPTDGRSTRTLPWGTGTNEISHTYQAVLPDEETLTYFFNLGGEFMWWPGYSASESTSWGDIDELWVAFINNYLTRIPTKDNSDPSLSFWTFDRNTYLYCKDTNLNTVTTYSNGGTLEMTVRAGIINTGIYTDKGIIMTATFKNTDVGDWFIAPTSGYWNYQV